MAISNEVKGKPFLRMHVEKLFSRYMKLGNIENMLGALGWKGFRDRLSSSYIYHFYHGFFPSEDELDNIGEVIKFEDDLVDLFPEGNSRIFFLGFFLKMCEVQVMRDNADNFISFLSLSKEVKEVLSLGDQKVLKPDWLILTIIHFEYFFGKGNLVKYFKEDNGDFDKLKSRLEEEQLENMIQNFLRYGASINDDDIFIFEKV
jgi:hypothetical protein